MHFAYLQDDLRVNDRLTLNLGLRYEYATPWVEKDNILSNFDPDDAHDGRRRSDGSLQDRSTLKPDRNNFGPRLGFAYTLTPETVLRGGYGVSYVHFHRAGGANVLPINGPQVDQRRRRCRRRRRPDFRTTQQGYPAGLTDPSRFNPLRVNITYMPEDYHSSHVQSWFVSVQRELWRRRARRPRLHRQSRRRPAAVCQPQPGGAEQQRRHAVAAVAAADSRSSATSPTPSTAASRATTRSRASSTGGSARASRS